MKAHDEITEMEQAPLTTVAAQTRRKPGPKPGSKRPKPKAAASPSNGHRNGTGPARPLDPVAALRAHLAHLDAEAGRLGAESTRVKRALAALET